MKLNKKEMRKEYLLINVGGMNGEIWSFEERFDDLNKVFEYCSREGILDNNGVRFRNVYDEDYWESFKGEIEGMWDGYYGDMNDGLDEWIDRDKESVNRVYGINEYLELYELNVFGE